MTETVPKPSAEAIEIARRAIRRGAPLGAAIPKCLCFRDGGMKQPECAEDGCCFEAKVMLADALDAFAAQARTQEREQCAQIAVANVADHGDCSHGDGYMDGRLDAAAAIRARNDPTSEGKL